MVKKILLTTLISLCALNESCYSLPPDQHQDQAQQDQAQQNLDRAIFDSLNSPEWNKKYEDKLREFSTKIKDQLKTFVLSEITQSSMSNELKNKIKEHSYGYFIDIKAMRMFFKEIESIQHFMSKNNYNILLNRLQAANMSLYNIIEVNNDEILLPTISKKIDGLSELQSIIGDGDNDFKNTLNDFNNALNEYAKFRKAVIDLLNKHLPSTTTKSKYSLVDTALNDLYYIIVKEVRKGVSGLGITSAVEEVRKDVSRLGITSSPEFRFFKSFMLIKGQLEFEVLNNFKTIEQYIVKDGEIAKLELIDYADDMHHEFKIYLDVEKVKQEINKTSDLYKKAALHSLLINYYQYLYEKSVFTEGKDFISKERHVEQKLPYDVTDADKYENVVNSLKPVEEKFKEIAGEVNTVINSETLTNDQKGEIFLKAILFALTPVGSKFEEKSVDSRGDSIKGILSNIDMEQLHMNEPITYLISNVSDIIDSHYSPVDIFTKAYHGLTGENKFGGKDNENEYADSNAYPEVRDRASYIFSSFKKKMNHVTNGYTILNSDKELQKEMAECLGILMQGFSHCPAGASASIFQVNNAVIASELTLRSEEKKHNMLLFFGLRQVFDEVFVFEDMVLKEKADGRGMYKTRAVYSENVMCQGFVQKLLKGKYGLPTNNDSPVRTCIDYLYNHLTSDSMHYIFDSLEKKERDYLSDPKSNHRRLADNNKYDEYAGCLEKIMAVALKPSNFIPVLISNEHLFKDAAEVFIEKKFGKTVHWNQIKKDDYKQIAIDMLRYYEIYAL